MLPNHHNQHQQIRGHLRTTYTYHTKKIHQKEALAPQDNNWDTLTSPHCKIPPQCINSYEFFCVNETPFLHTKSGEIYFRLVQA